MTWVAVAVGGAALVSGMIGAKSSSDAARSASRAQQRAAAQAAQMQWDMYNRSMNDQLNMFNISRADQLNAYNQSRRDQMPWITAGKSAVNALSGLTAAGPGEFKESPSYQFAFDEGMRGIQRAASASGRLGSGAYLKDATKYAEGMASQEYGNFLDRYYKSLDPYFRMAGLGSNVSLGSGQQGISSANALANTAMNTGQGLASNYMNTGQGLANTYMQAGQAAAAGNLGAAYPWNQLANYASGQLGNYAVNRAYGGQNYGQNALTIPQYWSQSNYTPSQMNTMTWL